MDTKPAISVGIVDDSARDRSHIEALLLRYQEEHGISCQIRHFSDGGALLDNYQPDFDVIFLDIKMEGIDGMRTAQAVRAVDSKVTLIFVTSTAQYATTGYSVAALSYLLKPVSYFAFKVEMDRCLAQILRSRSDSIVVGAGTTLRRIDVADIVYLESKRHKLIVQTVSDRVEFTGTLKSFEDLLAHKFFARANSGYLVNLRHLRAIQDEEALMSNGDRLKISRSRKKGLLQAMTNYVGGQLP